MVCPECGNIVQINKTHCDRCGIDLTTYKKTIMLSNKYYNAGLEKAKVRDLSGAILVLKKSLEMNKKNTNARNLLGLVYYEIGETVSALSEWVISKHFQKEENDADTYMNALQSNPTKLEALNQTIKKYNLALQSANQGNEDLAIIQLKKVTSLNPHYVKALQFLSLLYIKIGEKDKALKCLQKAIKIDVSNTTTLRYIHEIDELSGTVNDLSKSTKKETTSVLSQPTVFPMSSYSEDKPNVWYFLNLIIGVIIGVGVLFFLIVPTVKNNAIADFKATEVQYGEQLSKQTNEVSTLENENKNLKSEVSQLEKQLESFKGTQTDGKLYDNLFNAVHLYISELTKKSSGGMDYASVAKALSSVNAQALDNQAGIDLYNEIKNATFVQASQDLFNSGHDLYTNGKYDKALEVLLQANEYDAQNLDAIYFIGRSYHQLNNFNKAKEYYSILTKKYPDTSRAEEAKDRLAELD